MPEMPKPGAAKKGVAVAMGLKKGAAAEKALYEAASTEEPVDIEMVDTDFAPMVVEDADELKSPESPSSPEAEESGSVSDNAFVCKHGEASDRDKFRAYDSLLTVLWRRKIRFSSGALAVLCMSYLANIMIFGLTFFVKHQGAFGFFFFSFPSHFAPPPPTPPPTLSPSISLTFSPSPPPAPAPLLYMLLNERPCSQRRLRRHVFQ